MEQRGDMVPIVDQEAIITVMEFLLNEYGKQKHDRQKRLATALNISQSQVSRLASEKGPSNKMISLRLHEKIGKLLDRKALKEEQSSLVGLWFRAILRYPEGEQIALGYINWINTSRIHARYGAGAGWIAEDGALPEFLDGERWIAARDQAFQSLQTEFADKLDSFREVQESRGHAADRVDLAVNRILSPLLDHHFSADVERSWTEANSSSASSERQDFVAAGIEREDILLKRPVDRIALYRAAAVVNVHESDQS